MLARSGDRNGLGAPSHEIVREVDTRGTHCPGPLLEAIRLVRESTIGDTVAVIAGDPSATESITTWTQRAGHAVAVEPVEGGRRFFITRSR
jgi:TusA-related sulfurtransferase